MTLANTTLNICKYSVKELNEIAQQYKMVPKIWWQTYWTLENNRGIKCWKEIKQKMGLFENVWEEWEHHYIWLMESWRIMSVFSYLPFCLKIATQNFIIQMSVHWCPKLNPEENLHVVQQPKSRTVLRPDGIAIEVYKAVIAKQDCLDAIGALFR